jgi:hypothetical protein
MGLGHLEGLSVVMQRSSGVQPPCLYLHVLLKLHVNKKFVFLAAVSMNNTVACYVIPLLLLLHQGPEHTLQTHRSL